MEATPTMNFWFPHAHCVSNDPAIITMHVVGDLGTALAYALIPCAIVWTSWRYRANATAELRALLLHGASFIVACGGTHAVEAWNWWHADYMFAAFVKIFCALVSLTFVWRMWRYLRNHPLKSTE